MIFVPYFIIVLVPYCNFYIVFFFFLIFILNSIHSLLLIFIMVVVGLELIVSATE